MKNRYQAIYTFFEKDGQVTSDIVYYLRELKKVISSILVVVNGKINPESRKILQNLDVNILVRANEGLDFGAWQAGIQEIGWDKIRKLDGLLLCNCTCFGPFYPFQEMFDFMAKKECDFWGINRHPERDVYFISDDSKSKVIEHLQSYFLFFRSSILKDAHFRKWWDNLVLYSDYKKEVGYHETKFTKYLEDAGFKSASYMDFDKYKDIKDNASLLAADKQLIQDRNPLVKKRLFFLDNIQWLNIGLGNVARNALNYIETQLNYPIEYIWEYLLKTQQMSVLRNNLHLNFYLSKYKTDFQLKDQKIALILFVYYDDLVDYCVKYAKSMPKGSSIFVVSAKQSLLDIYKSKFSSDYKLECRLMENQGRDVAAYLVTTSDVYKKFDYVCCMHDKKTKQLCNRLTGEDFSYYCWENNLASSEFVYNVVKTFEQNKQLGMLVPPVINFADFYPHLGHELTVNKKVMQEVYSKLNLTIPFDEHPVAPYGTMFWVRGKAFQSIFNYKWKYSDFPLEPLPVDGTILHALERIYPMTVQEDGFYVGWLASDEFSSLYLDNQLYMLGKINEKLFPYLGLCNFLGLLMKLEYHFSMQTNFQQKNPITENVLITPKFKKTIRVCSWYKYLFYLILSKITYGKINLRFKQKKQFWQQIKKDLKR